MTRPEREMLVERYLAFEMSAEQEQEFIMQAAIDGELRQILRASRLVDRALEKNRDAFPPAGFIDVRDHALALLAATPAPVPAEPLPRLIPHRPRFGSWLVFATTALFFSAIGFLSHDLVERDDRRPAVIQQPAAVTGPETRDSIQPDSGVAVAPREVRSMESAPADNVAPQKSRSAEHGSAKPLSVSTTPSPAPVQERPATRTATASEPEPSAITPE